MAAKLPLKKETIRFFREDVDLIRQAFPGGYGQPGINEIIREVLHSWVQEKLLPQLKNTTEQELDKSSLELPSVEELP